MILEKFKFSAFLISRTLHLLKTNGQCLASFPRRDLLIPRRLNAMRLLFQQKRVHALRDILGRKSE
jgi:hypothetical protein